MFEDDICKYCQQAPNHNTEEQMQLLRLRDCMHASDKGLVDRGFPKLMKLLSARGWVHATEDGHQITDAGRAFVRLHERWFETC
jgi:hypothetical protein